MSLKNNKRSFINNFVWYFSGLNVRELSSLYQSRSNYFGIGGINIFSTVFLFLLGTISLHIAFPSTPIAMCILFGLILSFLVFIFNRQTINALSMKDTILKNQRHSLTLFPIFLFSIFIGLLISVPIQFSLFNISYNPSLFNRVKELHLITDADLSAKITSWSFSLFIALLVLLPTIIQYYSLRSKIKNNRGSLLNELMWFCSGANKEIIRTCTNDHSKYFGIGGTILFTALMACLSGGYAFYTAFNSSSLAIYFGLFWGAMIFNLDRFIVNTMYSDGKPGISWLEIVSGLPRIVIAIFLGIVISYPLELKIFEDKIEAEMSNMQALAKQEADSLNRKAFGDIPQNKNAKLDLQNKNSLKDAETKDAFRSWQSVKQVPYSYPTTDENGNTKIKKGFKWPQEYYDKKNYYLKIEAQNNKDIAATNIDIDVINSYIKSGEVKKAGFDSLAVQNIKALTKFSARSAAFSRLKDDPKDKSIFHMSLFIMILLIIIEITPVLLKMMLSTSDYDVILDADRNEIKTRELVRMSRDNDWANTEILKTTEENKKKIAEKKNELNTELNSNLELLSSIAKAQSEIAQIAIEKWKQDEIKKASLNPINIIQSNATASTLSFEDKFWLYKDTSEEYTYVFKSGITNELWLKNKDIVNIGKWFKVNSNQLEIELNSDKKIYDIEELTDATFLLCESGTTNKLQLTAV